jgi:hypothetical protein
MKGGFKSVEGKKKKQKAIVDFVCAKDLEGDENLWDPEDKYVDGNTKREEKAGGEPSLQFVEYNTSDKDEDVLKLLWKTKYACESTKKEEDEAKKNHWGFFTWFIIMYVVSQTWQECSTDFQIAPFYRPRPTSFSDPGSTTTDTERADGTSYLTGTRYEMCHTYSKTGCGEL